MHQTCVNEGVWAKPKWDKKYCSSRSVQILKPMITDGHREIISYKFCMSKISA